MSLPPVYELPGGRFDHGPGIFFNLDEDAYHADIAIGSTDTKTLARSPAQFWWESKMNPLWEPSESTQATIVGDARHCYVLHGPEEFARRYGRKTLNWSTVAGKLERSAFEERGWTPLDSDVYDRTKLTKVLIEANPYLRETFADPIAKEVSVFWTARGIKKKARFDALKIKSIVDLKNIANEKNIEFGVACLRHMHNYNLHVQADHYREARLAMRGLWEDGLVRGDHDAAFLEDVVHAREFAFVFVFLQKTGAPLVDAYQLSYRILREDDDGKVVDELNPIFNAARAVIDRAERNYERCMSAFGTDAAWVEPRPIKELDSSQMKLPSWFLRETDWESV